MMRFRIGRLVWIIAWSLWLAYGYALYVVAPRAQLPPTAVLNKRTNDWMLGFLADEPLVVSFDGGADGLDVIRLIVADSPRFLRPHGRLMMEIGFDDEQAVRQLFEANGGWRLLPSVKRPSTGSKPPR